MAGSAMKKRSFSDGPKGSATRPTKKQRKLAAYHSSSEESASDDEGTSVPANLLDSEDEDLDNIEVDDGASSASSASDSDSDLLSEREPSSKRKPALKSQQKPTQGSQTKPFIARDAPESDGASSAKDSASDGDGDDDDDDDDSDSISDAASHSHSGDSQTPTTSGGGGAGRRPKSKRNDPAAFATSISKMLSSKLPASRRADPIVARSAAAAEQARAAADAALEAKARRRLREQKRLAMEKGRVRDVLVASKTRTLNLRTGEIEETAEEGAETTAQILERERRLRKVAQRGVVKLFNAVRAAQVKAAEAERAVRREGVVGAQRREEKINEMSRKGFLDLIASGGGGLKKGGLEEA
ncbi:f7073071-8b84-4a8e-a3ab-59a1f2ef8ba3 [Thermothielavioides terrestris]|uniref:F7073071-8b84-4a8e-a3ab-59a1f2ef8ba3 n=1 Tax=Thermothielavioides terrestris TaxID=2587410 RepID=A0A3S4D3J6_9PEZI|nr:f7073071-8b84-4a8e-a3ab-59a1f2ef8ba3 [Thermothielavioides terrestris]